MSVTSPSKAQSASVQLTPDQGTTQPTEVAEPLQDLYEEEKDDGPPEATIARRAKSYSDFYDVVKAQIEKDAGKRRRRRKKDSNFDALALGGSAAISSRQDEPILDLYNDELLEASQQEYTYAT